MMVFIPLSDPIEIAKILDYKRLGKQRVEAKQIINIISGEAKSKAWLSHPVIEMWRPYLAALKYYYDIMVFEWIKRGYINHMPLYNINRVEMPWFMNCRSILDSHKATLLRKYNSYYKQYFKVDNKYMTRRVIWPIKKYLTDEQINNLKLNKKIKLDEYTKEADDY